MRYEVKLIKTVDNQEVSKNFINASSPAQIFLCVRDFMSSFYPQNMYYVSEMNKIEKDIELNIKNFYKYLSIQEKSLTGLDGKCYSFTLAGKRYKLLFKCNIYNMKWSDYE